MSHSCAKFRPVLFASTRVVLRPHIGTFFGWVKPIVEQARSHDVTVLLCDLQSFDGVGLPTTQEINRLRNHLSQYLPGSVRIYAEREIQGLEALLPLLLNGSGTRALMRNPTLQALVRRHELRLGHLIYPALMAADLLAVRPNIILTRDEGYRAFEWPFEVMGRLSRLVGSRAGATPHILGSPRVRVVDDTGVRLRRSAVEGPVIGLQPNDTSAVDNWIMKRRLQPDGPGSARWSTCQSPKSLWQALPELGAPCQIPDTLKCGDCLFQLRDHVRAQLMGLLPNSPTCGEAHDEEPAAAATEHVSQIFRLWLPLSRTSSSGKADAVAFIPADIAKSDLASWIALSFGHRCLMRHGGRQIRFDVVVLATLDRKLSGPLNEIAKQLEVLRKVGAAHGVDCNIITPDQVLKSGDLLAGLYEVKATGRETEVNGALEREVNSCLLEVLCKQYDGADCIELAPDRVQFSEFEVEPAYSVERAVPRSFNGWQILEPVRSRLSRPFAEVVRKYPTADSIASEAGGAKRLQELHVISTEWWGILDEQKQHGGSFARMKEQIVEGYRNKWRTIT